jgi:hypothetical protein
LWRIICSGYEEPKDLDHMTPNEIVAHQLNFQAKSILQKHMSDELYIRTSLCNTAKEIWDSLKKIHEGDESIKGSNFEKLRMKYESFSMRMDETPEQVYIRLNGLVIKLKSLKSGISWLENHELIKNFLLVIILTHEDMTFQIHQSPNFATLTPDDVFSIFKTHREYKETA